MGEVYQTTTNFVFPWLQAKKVGAGVPSLQTAFILVCKVCQQYVLDSIDAERSWQFAV